MINPLATQLYHALRRIRRNDNLLAAAGSFFYLALSEADVALIMEAMTAYEDAATVARPREGLPAPDDERARLLAERLAGNNKR